MDLYSRLLHLYPGLQEDEVEWENRNGQLTFITWNEAKFGPQPDIREVEKVSQQKADKAIADLEVDAIDKDKRLEAIIYAVADALSGKTRDQFLGEIKTIHRTLKDKKK